MSFLGIPSRTSRLPEFHIRVLVWPLLAVIPLWLVYYAEMRGIHFPSSGLHPERAHRFVDGFWYPLLHADLKHLLNNSIPTYVLLALGSYFYRYMMPWVIAFAWVFSALFLISYGRPSYHLGFSGIVYSMAYFQFFSGLMRRHRSLLAVSLIVAFLYGSMVWGIFPLEEKVSWEGHLGGAIAGAIASVVLYPFGLHRPPGKNDDEVPDWWYEANNLPNPNASNPSIPDAPINPDAPVKSPDSPTANPWTWTKTSTTDASVKRGTDGQT